MSMQNISDSNSETSENKWLMAKAMAKAMADAIIQYAKTNNCAVLLESYVKNPQLRKTRLKS